jgi:DNA-binding HxlR family transcriptional regulator
VSRSYGQLCGLALALDAIGDRWSLLIVRELLVRPEGARYTDLRDGLPGIATNLLADRLRQLEAAGVLQREEPRPPVATPLFRLTELGQGLRTPVSALAVWGGEQVPTAQVGEVIDHGTRPPATGVTAFVWGPLAKDWDKVERLGRAYRALRP